MTSLLSEIIQCNEAKILETLIENKDMWIDIIDISNISETPLDETIDYLYFLKKNSIVKPLYNQLSGNQKFQLNQENKIAKALLIFEHVVFTFKINKENEGINNE